MIKQYNPPWFYFQAMFGVIWSHVKPSVYKYRQDMKYERVYLDHEHHGKLVLDVRPKLSNLHMSNKKHVEKVIILLHGVTGSSEDPYMQDLSGVCAENGINAVLFNHYAPSGEQDCRLMDLKLNKHLDEVIMFA